MKRKGPESCRFSRGRVSWAPSPRVCFVAPLPPHGSPVGPWGLLSPIAQRRSEPAPPPRRPAVLSGPPRPSPGGGTAALGTAQMGGLGPRPGACPGPRSWGSPRELLMLCLPSCLTYGAGHKEVDSGAYEKQSLFRARIFCYLSVLQPSSCHCHPCVWKNRGRVSRLTVCPPQTHVLEPGPGGGG